MIQERKSDHIDIVLRNDVTAHRNWWDHVHLVHEALPEVDLDQVDTSCTLFGKRLRAPVVISAMTGGVQRAEEINRNLASAAAEFGIGLGLGSQRAAIENPETERTYSVVTEYDIPLVIANLGAPQLIGQRGAPPYGLDEARKAMEMIDADLLAIHLNFLQEVVQPEGERRARGCLASIRELAESIPVIVKETGAGLSPRAVNALAETKIKGVDVGGLSGTSFSAVEVYRAGEGEEGDLIRRLGTTFWDWGIPTPVSLMIASQRFEVLATGGIRNGLDVARAITLGAGSAGIAGALLRAATTSRDAVVRELRAILTEFRAAMFLTGCRSVEDLRRRSAILDAPVKNWLRCLEEV